MTLGELGAAGRRAGALRPGPTSCYLYLSTLSSCANGLQEGSRTRAKRKAEQMDEVGSGGRKLLIVGADSRDFVWRGAGAIAVATSRGGEARVVALSYGERGESGDLWDEPDQTVET